MRIKVQAVDAIIIGGTSLFLLLGLLFAGRLSNPAVFFGRNLLALAAYGGVLCLLPRLRSKPLRFAVRTLPVQLMFLQVFVTARDLQLLFFAWNDDRVLAWEEALFGGQPLVWAQKLHSPLMSEWMFFVYVVYVVVYPILAAVIFFKRGEEANEDYLFHLGLINLLCGLGFILFPVAGPLRWDAARRLLTEPIPAGGLFGFLAEAIREHVHAPGGTIPSPHAAVATVMWFMARKHTRSGFILLTPIILSLYVSTFYGRFHYVSDVIVGIALAVPVLLGGHVLEKALDGLIRSEGGRG